MKQVNYRNLKAGQQITVVLAWGENTSFDDIASGHFYKTTVSEAYFEKRGEHGFLRVFAKDGDGETRRVNYILEDNRICTTAVVVSVAELTKFSEMLCLNDRKDEFRAALRRAEQSDLEVFPDYERDAFVVVNKSNDSEYRVSIEASNGSVFGKCACADFKYKKRVCKHLSSVLADTFFGALYGEKQARINA